MFCERSFTLDASRLHEGEHVVTFDLLPAKRLRGTRRDYPYFGVVYDFVQLEVK